VRLAVDADGCMGHGRCYTAAPDLLTYDEEGYVAIRGQAIDVPDDQREAAEEAAGSCPEEAISLIKLSG
jgi:ferredoxin